MSKPRAIIGIVDELLNSGKLSEPFTSSDVENAYKADKTLQNKYPIADSTISTDLSNLDVNKSQFVSSGTRPAKYWKLRR
jgi:hypothetical protein